MVNKIFPKISVVMAVYNREEFIREAIDSILNQTFPDFEFILIDDGSTDNSTNIIKSYNDDRIILIQQENKGMSVALNVGIKASKCKYIARLDDDDIALPTRLEKQFEFLENNPEYVAVGSWMNWISADGRFLSLQKMPSDPTELKNYLPQNMPVPHAGSLYRKKALEIIGGYKELGPNVSVEDNLLMIDLAKEGDFYNIPEVLNLFRITHSSISQRSRQYTETEREIIKKYYYENEIDYLKIKYIDKVSSNVSKRKKKTYYYNRIGRLALSSNRLLSMKYLLLGFLYDPFSFKSIRGLLLTIFPKNILQNLYKKVKNHLHDFDKT